MVTLYKKIVAIFLVWLCISTVSASDTTIILDSSENAVTTYGDVYVLCALAMVVFAIIIIIKILLSGSEQ